MSVIDALWAMLAKLEEENIDLVASRDLAGIANLEQRRLNLVAALQGKPSIVIWDMIAEITQELTVLIDTSHKPEEFIRLATRLNEIAEFIGGYSHPLPEPVQAVPTLGGSAPPAMGSTNSDALPPPTKPLTGWVSKEHLAVARAAFGKEPLTLDLGELGLRTKMVPAALKATLSGVLTAMRKFDNELQQGYHLNADTLAVITTLYRNYPGKTLEQIIDRIERNVASVRR